MHEEVGICLRMNVLILAGGLNRSFYPKSHSSSRAMTMIMGVPYIVRLIDALNLEFYLSDGEHIYILVSKRHIGEFNKEMFPESKYQVETSSDSLDSGSVLKFFYLSHSDIDELIVVKSDFYADLPKGYLDSIPINSIVEFSGFSLPCIVKVDRNFMKYCPDTIHASLEDIIKVYESFDLQMRKFIVDSSVSIQLDGFKDMVRIKEYLSESHK